MSKLFVDEIVHQSSQGSGTITLGASGETIALASGASVTGNGLVGITEADQWSLTADTNNGVSNDITTNWEQPDYANWSKIGTGLTVSSGIFSFPQTGIYYIIGTFNVVANSGDAAAGVEVRTTTDNFTNGVLAAQCYAGNRDSGGNAFGASTFNFIFDVEDITTHKIKFATASFTSGTYIYGSTTVRRSGFTVIRLGDT